MTKEEYICKLLESIQDIFPVGKDFILLIKENALSDEMIDTLVTMLKEVRETVTDAAQKQKMEKTLEYIDQIKSMEQTDHHQDETKIQELEQFFTTL